MLQGGAGGEAVSMGFGCLPEDAPAVLAMFADVVQSPALPLQRIELYKAQASPGIKPDQSGGGLGCDGLALIADVVQSPVLSLQVRFWAPLQEVLGGVQGVTSIADAPLYKIWWDCGAGAECAVAHE
jgi:hypothetical protein